MDISRLRILAGILTSKKSLKEDGEPVYHTIFFKDGFRWEHYADKNNAEIAAKDENHLRKKGYKTIVLKVPQSQIEQAKNNPQDYVVQNYKNRN